MPEMKIFRPFNYRNEYERSLDGVAATILDDRGWEKKIECDDEGGTVLWVANGELHPWPATGLVENGSYVAADEIEVGEAQPF